MRFAPKNRNSRSLPLKIHRLMLIAISNCPLTSPYRTHRSSITALNERFTRRAGHCGKVLVRPSTLTASSMRYIPVNEVVAARHVAGMRGEEQGDTDDLLGLQVHEKDEPSSERSSPGNKKRKQLT